MVKYVDFHEQSAVDVTIMASGIKQIGVIIMTNVSPTTVAFKFGDYNAKKIKVGPPYGILIPEQEKKVTVQYSPKDSNIRHVAELKILVTPLDEKFEQEQDIPQLFKRATGNHVQEHLFSFTYYPDEVREELREESYAKERSKTNTVSQRQHLQDTGIDRHQSHRSKYKTAPPPRNADGTIIPKQLYNMNYRPRHDSPEHRKARQLLGTWSPHSSPQRVLSHHEPPMYRRSEPPKPGFISRMIGKQRPRMSRSSPEFLHVTPYDSFRLPDSEPWSRRMMEKISSLGQRYKIALWTVLALVLILLWLMCVIQPFFRYRREEQARQAAELFFEDDLPDLTLEDFIHRKLNQ